MSEPRKTRKVMIGSIAVGGGEPVRVQSMTKTDTRDIPRVVQEIRELEAAGCEIIRLGVPDVRAAESLGEIRIEIPTLGINYPIVGALYKENTWDLT